MGTGTLSPLGRVGIYFLIPITGTVVEQSLARHILTPRSYSGAPLLDGTPSWLVIHPTMFPSIMSLDSTIVSADIFTWLPGRIVDHRAP